jgi:hypothetical protein
MAPTKKTKNTIFLKPKSRSEPKELIDIARNKMSNEERVEDEMRRSYTGLLMLLYTVYFALFFFFCKKFLFILLYL